ncbi:hypothetical protein C8F01DRAFT_1362259 [Mycena amicta]|nr:hypothetical protein C8F01DRAFT_1362259 [Mycena amicta]
MAPITSLATELLVEIFRLCHANTPSVVAYMRSNADSDSDVSERQYQAKLTSLALRAVAGGDLAALEQVCHRFRNVVNGTPTLWAAITLDMFGFQSAEYYGDEIPVRDVFDIANWMARERNKHAWLVFLLQRAIERGQDLPLTITVRAHRQFPRQTLDMLVATAPRWHDVTLDVPLRMYHLLVPVAGYLDTLTTLRLHTVYDPMGHHATATQGLIGAFTNASRLANLAYTGSLEFVSDFPIEQLSRVQLGCVGAFDMRPLVELMQRCKPGCELAVELTLDSFGINSPKIQGRMHKVLVHSDIQALHIVVDDGPHTKSITPQNPLVSLFNALKLPNLESLVVNAGSALSVPIVWPATPALDMLSGSGTILRELYIVDVTIAPHDLINLLSALPALQSLGVGDKDHPTPPVITDAFFASLVTIAGGSHELLLPSLNDLQLWTLGAFTDSALNAILCAHLSGFKLLRRTRRLRLALMWMPSSARVLTPELAQTIEQGKEKGLLVFECAAFDLRG